MKNSDHDNRPMDMADWDARLRSHDCSAEERKAFMSWYGESARNRSEFDGLTDLLDLIRELGDEPEMRSIQEWAIDSEKPRPTRWWDSGVRLGAVAAGVAAIVVASLLLLQSNNERPEKPLTPTYATAVGERSTVTFADGTVADLNTDTELDLRFTERERVVELVRGQALFNVAKDEARPFVVVAGNQRIVAVGTVFDVRMNENTLAVTLVEGRVDVSPAAGTGSAQQPTPIRMNAGERLTTSIQTGSSGNLPLVETTDTQQATIWRDGRVFFDKTELSDAIAEMNRYSLVKIRLDQASLSSIPVSGMFRTGQQNSFVESLESYFPLEAIEINEDLIILRER